MSEVVHMPHHTLYYIVAMFDVKYHVVCRCKGGEDVCEPILPPKGTTI